MLAQVKTLQAVFLGEQSKSGARLRGKSLRGQLQLLYSYSVAESYLPHTNTHCCFNGWFAFFFET